MEMRITANQVSFARIIALPLPVYLLFQSVPWQWLSLLLFTIIGVTDYLDGYLARKYGSTEFGKFLDPISDKVFIAAMMLPLIRLDVFPLWPVILVFVREFMVTELRSIYNLTGASFTTSIMGKFKTNVQIFAMVMAMMNILLEGTIVMPVVMMTIMVPFWFLLAFTLIKDRRMHSYAVLLLITFALALLAVTHLDVIRANYFYVVIVLLFTLYSGIEYYLGGRPYFKRYMAGAPFRRWCFLLAGGVAVPALYCALAARAEVPLWIPLLIIAMEFVVGGLDNYLTMRKLEFSYGWKVIKLIMQIGPALALLFLDLPWAQILPYAALTATLVYSVAYVLKHRKELAAGSKPTVVS